MATKHLSPELLNERRLESVRLRLDGHTVAKVALRTGLSAPTVSSAWKSFREGGWDAVPVRARGRKVGQVTTLDKAAQNELTELLQTQPKGDEPGWSSRTLADALKEQGHVVSPRGIDHWLEARDLKPEPLALGALARKRSQAGRWYRQQALPVMEQVQQAGGSVWLGGVRTARATGETKTELLRYQLYLHGKRDALYTRCRQAPLLADDYLALFQRLLSQQPGKPVALVFHGAYFQASPDIQAWLALNPTFHLINVPAWEPVGHREILYPKSDRLPGARIAQFFNDRLKP